MKRLTAVTLALLLAACGHKPPPPLEPAVPAPPPAAKRVETPAFWRKDGQAALAELQKPVPTGVRAKNIILIVGDGMGLSTVTAARILQGQTGKEPAPGEENVLAFERFPSTALVKTYNFDLQTPESAGAMTAIMSGVKTRGSSVGLDQTPTRGQCKEAFGHEAKTLLEQAKDAGLAVGVVTTARVTHAVPAATYAHVSDRDWEVDSRMPAELDPQGCKDIARQLVEFDHHGAVDVVFGGGRLAFMGPTQLDPRDPKRKGVRRDGADLVATWQQRNPNGRYLTNGAQLKGVDWTSVSGPVMGLFAPDHMSYEADRAAAGADEPTLTEMTAAAIKGLSRNAKGYVLVIGAGGIDRAQHEGNAARALIDTMELSNAVAKAAELTSADDTLILVTSTNSHTLTAAGYPKRGDAILGLAHDETGAALTDAEGRPFTILGYANGPGYRAAGDPPPTDAGAAQLDYRQAAGMPMAAETHSGEDVPAYARGPGSQWVRGSVEQHTLYWIMQAALDGLNPLPPEPPKKKSLIPKLPKLKMPKLPFGK